MDKCEQTKGQSVLQHGISVRKYTFDLLNHLKNGSKLKHNWILPQWILDNKELILSKLVDDKSLKLYTTLHDAGKPYCLSIDDKGRHFENHAEVSSIKFSEIFQNTEVENLIKHDMDIHLLKPSGVDEFCKIQNHITLLFVGLCEIHSNSQMFGGTDSVSFKIKHKNITKVGKKIIEKLKYDLENKK
jgi:hypothetical protein